MREQSSAQQAYDDAREQRRARSGGGNGGAGTSVGQLDCKPWWVDAETIPPRAFLYEKHYARKCIGASIGAGGRAKTSGGLFEAVEMALGRNLSTHNPLPAGQLRVLCL